ncbi:MAG: hypothetical protein RRC34_04960 [Lentisphaeria bacterium]|nr:hypothetical protein [Lentisphaeria bacterium]
MTHQTFASRVDFSDESWARAREAHRRWWRGELGRPLIQMRLDGVETSRPEPVALSKAFAAFYDDSVSPETIVDRWDYDLSRTLCLGDAFPHVWPNFGPGVAAAFSGASLECDDRTVWFHPETVREVDDLKLSLDRDSTCFNRIAEIMKTATDFWQGRVQVGMTDLGGNLDILSTFRPGEALLFDLYDNPGAVKTKTWDAHRLWWESFQALNKVLQPINPGYTAWTPIFSDAPYYMLQCDFCYMIGPDMFDEFVKPELARTCEKLDHAFYHLDGPGQLNHLDSLLEIEALAGVQWIPGAGAKPITEWPEVYRKITDAGKKIQLFGSLEDLRIIADQTGRADNIVLIAGGHVKNRKAIEKAMAAFGV